MFVELNCSRRSKRRLKMMRQCTMIRVQAWVNVGVYDPLCCKQWRSKGGRGGNWEHAPWSEALGVHQHTFCKRLKTRFKQKFRSNYAEKCVFFI